ncbi:MAG TPA: hypothetical protein PKI33_10105, partial [Anaerolineales bacterium]|nr:hypothetical protein [Anaerolineales bacterium]
LALSFLLLIGFTLVVEGLHQHIPKGYVYFAMGFSVMVEMINLRVRGKSEPVALHTPYVAEPVAVSASAAISSPKKPAAKKAKSASKKSKK